MTYEHSRYKAVLFYGDPVATSVVAKTLQRLAQLTDVRLAIKAFRHHESSELASTRKRHFSDPALATAVGFAESGRSCQLLVFDERWSRECPPQVLVHAVSWAAGRNPFFFLAAFREPTILPDLHNLGQQWFESMNGTTGGVVRCPYILPDGTALEWAYRNNRGSGGDVTWRYAFDSRFA